MNDLYRIERVMDQGMEQMIGCALPGTDGMALLTSDAGFAFVKLHPVHVTAKRRAPCYLCDTFTAPTMMHYQGVNGIGTVYVTHCPNCGRLLNHKRKEGQA